MAKEKQENKKMNPFVKFLFMIVLPLLVAGILAVIVLSFVGFDVIGWSKEKLNDVPVVGQMIKTDEEQELSRKLATANDTIRSQREEIEQLKQQIEDLQAQVEEYEMELTKLENEEESAEQLDAESETAEDEEIKQLASSFRKMDKEQAARIVENLDTTTAVLLLSNISANIRGEILEQMDPQIAARLMQTMANE